MTYIENPPIKGNEQYAMASSDGSIRLSLVTEGDQINTILKAGEQEYKVIGSAQHGQISRWPYMGLETWLKTGAAIDFNDLPTPPANDFYWTDNAFLDAFVDLFLDRFGMTALKTIDPIVAHPQLAVISYLMRDMP